MFGWFKSKEIPSDTPENRQATKYWIDRRRLSEAEKIVFAFATIRGNIGAKLILPEDDLPFSKFLIIEAFRDYIELTEDDEGREMAKGLILRVSEYQSIDPEDRGLVNWANTHGHKLLSDYLVDGKVTDDVKQLVALQAKYNKRCMDEWKVYGL